MAQKLGKFCGNDDSRCAGCTCQTHCHGSGKHVGGTKTALDIAMTVGHHSPTQAQIIAAQMGARQYSLAT